MATTEDLKLWIDGIMKSKKEDNYELKVEGNGVKGEGYLGEITFVNVKTSSKKNYDFVIKSAKKSDKLREQTPLRKTYLREIFLFSKIFPVFEQFELENSIDEPFRKHAKCYNVCEEEKREAMVLENLKVRGFELHDRTVTMNLDHIQFVFVQYARFHAISMAMKKLKPELFRSITKDMDDNLAEFFVQTNVICSYVEYMKKSVKFLNASDAKKFEGYELELEEVFTKTTYDPEDPVTVILHGDCWNNNMMFKYDEGDKTKPVDMRFLDFQMSRVAHPILDLSYFLYACCDKEVLENFDSLLKLYHSTLSNCLSQYGINVNTFFPLSKLKEDWRTIGKYGLYMAVVVIQFALCESTEAIDFAETADTEQALSDVVVKMMRDDERFDNRVKTILEHFSQMFL